MTLFLIILGSALIIWNVKLSKFLYELQRPSFKFFFQKTINYESKWILPFLRIWLIVMGLFCLIGAVAYQFGPITIYL